MKKAQVGSDLIAHRKINECFTTLRLTMKELREMLQKQLKCNFFLI